MKIESMFPGETEADARQRIAAMRGEYLDPEERAHMDAEESTEKRINELIINNKQINNP